MKIRYRTMTLLVSILASVALVGTGFVAAPVADGAVVPAISDVQTATPTVIGQVPATFTGQMTVDRERTAWDRRWTAGSVGPDRTAPCDWRRGVIGMLRKLSRKARGIHHGP